MRGSRQGSWACWLARGLLLGVAIGALLPGLAQAGLYGPSAPPGAAWVRAVNAEAPGGLGISVAGGPLESVAFAGSTAYHAVEPGTVRIDLGGHVVSIEAEPGVFLTVVATASAFHVILDTPLVDVSRGLLALYNLTAIEALELAVVDGPTVVAGVAPLSQEAVTVTEAEVALEVRAGGERVATLEPRLYERGVAHSILVVEGADGPLVRYLKAVAAE